MSWCERFLGAHVDCVKSFLRECREQDLVYAPGSYSSHDRCMNTRQAYVDCVHDPNADKYGLRNQRVVQMQQGAAHPPQNFYGTKATSGALAENDLSRTWTTSPLSCSMELQMHGKCVENYLRNAITKNKEYVFLAQEAPDKCFLSRASFEQCIRTKRDREAAGEGDPVNNVRPRGGNSVVRSFSSRGRWVEMS